MNNETCPVCGQPDNCGDCNHNKSYRIVRMFYNGENQVIETDLTLDEAQLHCSDPATSSSTNDSEWAQDLVNEYGQWFDGYESE